MADKGNPPPPYPGTGVGFEQHSRTNPAAGQTNYGFSNPQQQQPGYAPQGPQPGYFVGQHHNMNNIVVAQIGGGNVYHEPAPVDYSTQAWLACLCCFWPTGLIAIMKASESRDYLARGDLASARSASNQARQMVRISYVIGIITFVALVVFLVILFGVVLTSSSSQCCVNGDCYDC